MIKLVFCVHIFIVLQLILHLHTIIAISGAAPALGSDILEFEYGTHIPGEELSFFYSGSLPPFEPIFTLNTTPEDPHLEKRFTYLKVHYISPISKVILNFDPHTMILSIHQKFPFLSMPIGVHGYSMPLIPQSKRRFWSRMYGK